MKTELDIIYVIHDVVRSGKINQDDPINERLMRDFLRAHRGKHIFNFSKKGEQVPDEVFQNIKDLSFYKKENGDWASNEIPKIIRLKNNAGLIAEKNGYVISVLNSEEFNTSKKNPFNKYQPKLKFTDGKLHLYIGQKQECNDTCNISHLNNVIDAFISESEIGEGQRLSLDLKAILVDPDDEPGYDFTQSPYPFPDEYLEDLINSVNAREFNLFLRTKSDETGDGRNNSAEFQTREEL